MQKLGIFGSASDAQCQQIKAAAETRGVEVVLVESQALNQGRDHAFDGTDFFSDGKRLGDVCAWYVRYIMSPVLRGFEQNDEYYLYRDWYIDYMRIVERYSYQVSWLLSLSLQGIPVVNPLPHGSVIQMKPFQLAVAKSVGLKVPETLITNTPERVWDFYSAMQQRVVYKPTEGGAYCEKLTPEVLARLDLITKAPVTFQELIVGVGVRLTVIGNEIVSAVEIPTEGLDYRTSPDYIEGKQQYVATAVPEEIKQKTLRLLEACGLFFCGADFIKTPDGDWVFLEANPSPVYLDIEHKTQTPISDLLVEYLLKLGNEPKFFREALNRTKRTESFFDYLMPYSGSMSTGSIFLEKKS